MAAKRKEMGVSGGAPLIQTLETIKDVPDIPPADIAKKKRLLRLPPGSRLAEQIDGLTPKMKLWLERTRRTYRSGYKNLDTLGPVGAALRKMAEYAVDIQDRGSQNDSLLLKPHMQALVALTKRLTPEGTSRKIVMSGLSKQIFEFMEDNTPIDDPELLEIAEGWKEAWRTLLTRHVAHMLQLRKEVEGLPGNERVVIRRSDGSVVRDWQPILPGHVWNDKKSVFKRDSDGAELDFENAILESDRLYMPHEYEKAHWNAIVNQLNSRKIIQRLDTAAKGKGNKVPGFKFNKGTNQWTFERTGDVYASKQDAIDGAKDYWTKQYAIAQEQLAGKVSAVIGRYGHLEIARETTDKLYFRDVTSLLNHVEMFWHRVGEIIVWGQYDPLLGSWPRLAQYTAQIGETALNSREGALMAVVDTLMQYDMFEKMPASLKAGETSAANAMQNWNTPDLQRMRTDNPDAFSDEVMETLVEIGFAVKKSDGTYQIKGESEDAQRSTFIYHLVPHFQTMHLREDVVLNIARGIGHWQPSDPLNENAGRVWSALNHITTTLTLGFGTSLQNLGEVPLLATVAGSKNTIAGLQRIAKDKEFREMLPKLGAALSRARDYLADTDTQSKYLQFILFTPTEKWSRLTGVAVGWESAKDAIQNYISEPTPKNSERLQELNISVETIKNYQSVLAAGHAPAFSDLVKEAEGRVLEGAMMIGGLRKPDAPPASNAHVDLVGDEMARAARYVSTRVFKGYNALSLPNFLTQRDPLVRTLFKFKAWAAQMHQFMWEQFNYARRQAGEGNWGPAWRLAQGFVGMGLSASMIGAFFTWAAGREDEDSLLHNAMDSIAMAHTLGIGSMIMEIAMIAEGNPYRASQMINSALGSPTAGIVARVGGEIVSGDPASAASTTFWQLPGVRELKRFGARPLKELQAEDE